MVEVCLKIAVRDGIRPDAPSITGTIECLERVPKLDLPSMYELEEPAGEGQSARCYMAHKG